MQKLLLVFVFIYLVMAGGCTTYHLSTQSMLEQFANSGSEKKIIFMIVPPYLFFPGVVKGNDLEKLTCIDKNGIKKTIEVTNRTSVRITRTDGKRETFYFNTLLLKDSTITGSKTHFANVQIRPIKFSDIAKIEVQE